MSRDIKFKIWDKKKKKMFYSYDNYLKVEGELWSLWEKTDEGKLKLLTNSNEGVLMLFTGLKDKNGKEIYEGDIFCGGEENFIIYWNEKMCRFYLKSATRNYHTSFDTFDYLKDIEIIGNIYENPELLEKSD